MISSGTKDVSKWVGDGASSFGSAAMSGLGKLGSGAAAGLSGLGKFATTALGSMGNWIMDMIAGNEGARTRPYKDSLGLWTVGVGHLIGNGKTLPPEMNREFSKKEIQEMYKKDFDHHASAAARIPGFDKMNEKGKAGLIDLTFNMGPAWYKKWPNTVKALEAGDTESAAAGLQNSKWYGQVGNRAARTVDLIRHGRDNMPKSAFGDMGYAAGDASSKLQAARTLQAAKGGVFEGPTSGYPVQLHGKEIVAPLNVDSILMKLAKTPASEELSAIQKSTKETLPEVKANTDHHSAKLNMEMVSMLSSKLDAVINVLEGTHSTQTKILRYSQV